MSKSVSRRGLLQFGAAATISWAAASSFAADELVGPEKKPSPRPDPWQGLKVGVASYSLRGLKTEAAVAAIRRVDLHYCSIKDVHLSLTSTTEERKAVAKQFRDAGITPLSCGNIKIPNDEAKARNIFEYARDIGATAIVCNLETSSLPLAEKMVKEFDIKMAIHNHGPEDKIFPSPYEVMKAIESFDKRIGLCIDVGHTARAGADPVKAIREFKDRLYDVHLKDLYEITVRNQEVEVGRGVLDTRGIFQALLDVKFTGHAGFEHEKDKNDPLPGLAESVGYSRAVVAACNA